MIVCGECQSPVEKIWKCKCAKHEPKPDFRIEKLQPFFTRLNGFANFLKFVTDSLDEIAPPSENKMELHFPILENPESEKIDDVIKAHILKVFELHKGNKMSAAKALGITSKTLYTRLEQYGLHEPKGKK